MTTPDTRDPDPASPICRNCWWRRTAPGLTTCRPCHHNPHANRANATWADLIAQVDADTTTDTTTRKAA